MSEKMSLKHIRALVVDDSAYSRRLISNTLNSIKHVEVVGTAYNGQEAITMAIRLKPNFITLDLEMPEMDGFTFLRWLMHNQPTPVIIISSEGSEENILKALDIGAVDFIVKPTRKISPELSFIQDTLVEKLTTIRNLKIDKVTARMSSPRIQRVQTKTVIPSASQSPFDLVAIGASTGGPPALQTILTRLPANFPSAIAVVQHMPPSFTRFFAERLNESCELDVKEAEEGDEVRSGRILIAPGGMNMAFKRYNAIVRVTLGPQREEDKFVPSVNAMMESSSTVYGGRTLGVLLTGMGDDGKIGMKAIKQMEGKTIAESEDTAIVFGMPAEAIKEGVVDHILGLGEITDKILSLCIGNNS
ncbi:MAG: chemotaxis response regulator protein-glutamate methylesterase [bacterium]